MCVIGNSGSYIVISLVLFLFFPLNGQIKRIYEYKDLAQAKSQVYICTQWLIYLDIPGNYTGKWTFQEENE